MLDSSETRNESDPKPVDEEEAEAKNDACFSAPNSIENTKGVKEDEEVEVDVKVALNDQDCDDSNDN